MCIWKVKEEDRKCWYCSYRGGCEKYSVGKPIKTVDEVVFGKYYDAICHVVGGDVLDQSRDPMYVWGRNMLAYKLFMEGYGYSAIGKVINRNHSTIYYAIGQVKNMLEAPGFYRSESKMWSDFNDYLNS